VGFDAQGFRRSIFSRAGCLVIVAIISISWRGDPKTLFPLIGPQGTTALRLAFLRF
jgi:threonine/homoserine efflux transporter RhtA